MQIDIQITRQSDDLAQDHFLDGIYNLLRIKELPDINGAMHPSLKAFNRLRGRVASLSDYTTVHFTVLSLCDNVRARSKTPMFVDQHLNALWVDGVVQTADLATGMWSAFLEYSIQDINNSYEGQPSIRHRCSETLTRIKQDLEQYA